MMARFLRKIRCGLELLKLALASGGRGMDCGTLISALWPDLEGSAGRNAFDIAVHRLRRLLQRDDAVSIHDGKLTLHERLIWTDTWWAFERAWGGIRETEAGDGSMAEASDMAQGLLDSYPGHFLPAESAYWALSTRERLRSKFLRSVSAVARSLENREQWDDTILLYSCARELDPLAEEFQRRLLLCYRAQGRIAEALDVYRRCRDLLSITLGVEPSAATQAVYSAPKLERH